MFSHVMVGVADLDRAMAFYEPVLAALGVRVRAAPSRLSMRRLRGVPNGGFIGDSWM